MAINAKGFSDHVGAGSCHVRLEATAQKMQESHRESSMQSRSHGRIAAPDL